MKPTKIIFLHGLEGSPTGQKATAVKALAEKAGYKFIAPDLPRYDNDYALQIAKKEIDKEGPDLIVASSRGANIALHIIHEIPTLALAPSFRFFGPPKRVPSKLTVVHGVHDDVAPLPQSLALVGQFGAKVVVTKDDHRLAESLPVILQELNLLLLRS